MIVSPLPEPKDKVRIKIPSQRSFVCASSDVSLLAAFKKYREILARVWPVKRQDFPVLLKTAST